MFEGIQELMRNPAMFFMKSKFKVPQNLTDPDEIVNYFLQTGQLSQDQINQVYAKYREIQGSGGQPIAFK